MTTAEVGNLSFINPDTTGTKAGQSFTLPTITQLSNGYQYDANNKFDLQMAFLEDDKAAAGQIEFGQGDVLSYDITSSLAGGVSVSDFNMTDVTSGLYYSVAQVDDAAKNTWIAATNTVSTSTAVPEPATVMAGALLLLPLGVSTLRMIRRARPV